MNLKPFLAALLCVITFPVLAGEFGKTRWGAFDVTPRFGVGLTTTDNLYNSDDSTPANTLPRREVSSRILTVSPGVKLEAGNERLNYFFDAGISAGFHSADSDDNYVDLDLGAGLGYSPTSRVKWNFDAGVLRGHEARGTGRQEGGTSGADEPDRYVQTDIGISFTYGAPSARGQLILSANHMNKEYQNNRQGVVLFGVLRGGGTSVRDHDSTGIGAVFKWRVQPKTRLLFEYRKANFDYDRSYAGVVNNVTTVTQVDSDEQRFFVGAEWDATAKTTGSIRVGRLSKDFDDSAGDDISTGAWEIGVDWKPKSYSVVSLEASRTTSETNGTGSAVETDNFTASWRHAWKDRLATTVAFSTSDNDYTGTARSDDLDSLGASIHYQFRRWLGLELGYIKFANDSNQEGFDFDSNNLFLNFNVNF